MGGAAANEEKKGVASAPVKAEAAPKPGATGAMKKELGKLTFDEAEKRLVPAENVMSAAPDKAEGTDKKAVGTDKKPEAGPNAADKKKQAADKKAAAKAAGEKKAAEGKRKGEQLAAYQAIRTAGANPAWMKAVPRAAGLTESKGVRADTSAPEDVAERTLPEAKKGGYQQYVKEVLKNGTFLGLDTTLHPLMHGRVAQAEAFAGGPRTSAATRCTSTATTSGSPTSSTRRPSGPARRVRRRPSRRPRTPSRAACA